MKQILYIHSETRFEGPHTQLQYFSASKEPTTGIEQETYE
jgi:hypothetical protein